MPPLANETIKYIFCREILMDRAELGRASWRLFHTILARFPEKPTLDEREALKSYIHLFARLYPCGEWYYLYYKINYSAAHFQAFLAANPPQTSSREAASQWGCHIHNKVNESLNKVTSPSTRLIQAIFDCSTIAEKYKCGCDADDEKNGTSDSKTTEPVTVTASHDSEKAPLSPLRFENSGLTRGG
jgi:FAD-linked sulfhydryl oxidase